MTLDGGAIRMAALCSRLRIYWVSCNLGLNDRSGVLKRLRAVPAPPFQCRPMFRSKDVRRSKRQAVAVQYPASDAPRTSRRQGMPRAAAPGRTQKEQNDEETWRRS